MAYVILGLGNPGPEYAHTRHNAGTLAVEHIHSVFNFPEWKEKKSAKARYAEGEIGGVKVTLVIPQVYMNLSGASVGAFVKSVKAAKHLIVVRDELDMPLGAVKMTVPGRGLAGHKGAESIARALKTKDFMQVKIGISGKGAKGVKKPKGEDGVVKHVIGKWKPGEEEVIMASAGHIANALETFMRDGEAEGVKAMNTA